MQDEVFVLLWVLKCHLEFVYGDPNWILPNRIALNQTMWNQTKACIAKSPCVDERENRA
jgi:hypothetical protein